MADFNHQPENSVQELQPFFLRYTPTVLELFSHIRKIRVYKFPVIHYLDPINGDGSFPGGTWCRNAFTILARMVSEG